MPLTATKRSRRRRRSKLLFSARSGEAPCSSSSNSGDDEASSKSALQRYGSLLADRLDDLLNLPPSEDLADIPDPPSVVDSFGRRILPIPSGEVVEALTRSAFLEDEMGDALVEYQVQKYLSEETLMYRNQSDGTSSRKFHSADVAADVEVYSVGTDFTYEEFAQDADKLISRTTPVDKRKKLNPKEVEELEVKHALYRIRACLLLKGKPIDWLDDAALECNYPRKLIVDNSYFLHYEDHIAFGWYFDQDLCQLASLTDYQRLVILNYWGDQYQDWSSYQSMYNTPETDRQYLLYWKAMTEKIKWVEDYMYVETTLPEWSDIRRKASYQAYRIATKFENIHLDLACLGIQEFIWSTRLYVYHLKDLDGVFFEIWKRVIKEENVNDCFAKALKEVRDLKMFPSRAKCMEEEKTMEEQFHQCTVGITKRVPECKARQLIAQQVRQKLAVTRGYEHYARKKLKVAEYIGLIDKAST